MDGLRGNESGAAKKLTGLNWRISESIERMKKFEKRLLKYEQRRTHWQCKFDLERRRFAKMAEKYAVGSQEAAAVQDDNKIFS